MQCPPYLLNADLCILMYQLYHQSVIWPLDPWYEAMASLFSSRRENFMARVHEWCANLEPADGYGGPNAISGWPASNTRLDPIITNYFNINPRLPTFNRDDTKFIGMKAPDYITNKLHQVQVARYQTFPTGPMTAPVEILDVCDYHDGTDHLIAFEGGTGVIGGHNPAWSLMGFVLMKKRDGVDGHDIHIVFRGSRSGDAVRALLQGLVMEKGNPDWVTDMDNRQAVADPWFTNVGKVNRGFTESAKTCFGTILAACSALHQQYGAPKKIYVSGHSLGGALAGELTLAVTLGNFGTQLRGTGGLNQWPWDDTRCIAYAGPTVADQECVTAGNVFTQSKNIWMEGDFVVWGGRKHGMGATLNLGADCKLEKIPGAPENTHELYIIRIGIIRLAQQARPLPAELTSDAPWAYYSSFSKLLAGASFSYRDPRAKNPTLVTERNLRSVLNLCHFASEFEQFLKLFQESVSDKGSYKMPNFLIKKKKLVKRRDRVHGVIGTLDMVIGGEKGPLLAGLENQVKVLSGTMDKEVDRYLGLGIILNAIQKSGLTIADIQTMPALKKCLDLEIKKEEPKKKNIKLMWK